MQLLGTLPLFLLASVYASIVLCGWYKVILVKVILLKIRDIAGTDILVLAAQSSMFILLSTS